MYNKIFTKILDSSVWLEPSPTRIVWITLLAAMDEDGFCSFAAIGNIAGRARVTIEEAKAALEILASPDPESSDPEFEGRRIERVSGGWMVLNAPKYREIVSRANAQEKTRERVRRYRERGKGNADVTDGNATKLKANDPVTPSEAYTEAEVVKKQNTKTLVDDENKKALDPAAIWVAIWNDHCGKLSKIRKVTNDFKKQITERKKEFSDEDFLEAVKMCAALPFTTGDNNQKWQATFGWLLRGKTPKNDGAIIGQVINGKYGLMPPPKDVYVEVTPDEWWGKDKPF